MTATLPINAIPAVVAAAPGIVTYNDLPADPAAAVVPSQGLTVLGSGARWKDLIPRETFRPIVRPAPGPSRTRTRGLMHTSLGDHFTAAIDDSSPRRDRHQLLDRYGAVLPHPTANGMSQPMTSAKKTVRSGGCCITTGAAVTTNGFVVRPRPRGRHGIPAVSTGDVTGCTGDVARRIPRRTAAAPSSDDDHVADAAAVRSSSPAIRRHGLARPASGTMGCKRLRPFRREGRAWLNQSGTGCPESGQRGVSALLLTYATGERRRHRRHAM